MITLRDITQTTMRFWYMQKRAKRIARKRNPKLKFNALYDMLKHPEKYEGMTLRIKMPADWHV